MSEKQAQIKFDLTPYTNGSLEEVGKLLDTSVEHGLTTNEVRIRHAKYATNALVSEEVHWWQILLRQFKSSFIYLLLVAIVVSFFLNQYIDAVMILIFVSINTILGFIQEYRSEKSVSLLKQFFVNRTKALRDGREVLIEAKELVPGDVVIIEAGDVIPADIRIIKDLDLTVNESALTGESVQVAKSNQPLKLKDVEPYLATNLGFSGTTVISGRGEGIVVATASNTVMGEVAHLTGKTKRESTFEKGIQKISNFILKLIVVTLVVIFFANLLIKGTDSIGLLLIFSLALAVSVVPEALPLVTTFSLSRGALELAKHKVVVKRLSAIEDLGSIEVLCSDKTGTLTENVLSVSKIYGHKPDEVMFDSSLASTILKERNKEPNNAFDLALWNHLSFAERKHVHAYGHLNELPFDPSRRRNSVLIKNEHQKLLIVRGAPETITHFCDELSLRELEKIHAWMAAEGKAGHRIIAVAKKAFRHDTYKPKDEESGMTFVGMISFNDPIKASTIDAVKKAEHLGVKVKMLTGDNREVAAAVGLDVGLITDLSQVITGDQLTHLSHVEKVAAVEKCAVFARVSPEQKYEIIQLLQESHEVGFLGEGINDAPALKAANVGLVVSGASDIAREAADIVLLERSLAVIVDGIKEGRKIFANILKYIKATLSSNFGNFYAIAVSTLFIDFLPMLPLQILLVNLLTDFPLITVAADNVDHRDIDKPRSYNVKNIALLASILGVVSTVFDFIVFGLFYRKGAQVLQSNWFIASILTELVFIYSIRTRHLFFKTKRPATLLLLLTSLAFVVTIVIPYTKIGQEIFSFTPPSMMNMTLILALVAAYFISTEAAKLFYYQFMGEKHLNKHKHSA